MDILFYILYVKRHSDSLEMNDVLSSIEGQMISDKNSNGCMICINI